MFAIRSRLQSTVTSNTRVLLSTLSDGIKITTGEGSNGFVALKGHPDPESIAGGDRDFIGYCGKYPNPQWPGDKKLALNFVVNFEEGSEASIHHGDDYTEVVLTDGARSFGEGKRNMGAESLFEYGSRVGFWRLMSYFEKVDMPVTMYACAVALEGQPESAKYIRDNYPRTSITSHGWRWWAQNNLSRDDEREHIRLALESFNKTLGITDPSYLGWYGRYAPSVQTRELLIEAGFKFDSDAYNDDLPYWTKVNGKQHLVVPYSIQNNDVHLAYGNLATGDDFYQSMKDAIDCLLEEGHEGAPKLMTIGLHMRLVGQPKYARSIKKLVEYVDSKSDEIWVATRKDIAKHWCETPELVALQKK